MKIDSKLASVRAEILESLYSLDQFSQTAPKNYGKSENNSTKKIIKFNLKKINIKFLYVLTFKTSTTHSGEWASNQVHFRAACALLISCNHKRNLSKPPQCFQYLQTETSVVFSAFLWLFLDKPPSKGHHTLKQLLYQTVACDTSTNPPPPAQERYAITQPKKTRVGWHYKAAP